MKKIPLDVIETIIDNGVKAAGVKTQFIYDNASNLLKDDRAKYTYDAFNHTEKVETFDGHVQIKRYDAEGLRHEMEEDGKLVQFIFRGDEIVAEEKGNNIIRFIKGYDLKKYNRIYRNG